MHVLSSPEMTITLWFKSFFIIFQISMMLFCKIGFKNGFKGMIRRHIPGMNQFFWATYISELNIWRKFAFRGIWSLNLYICYLCQEWRSQHYLRFSSDSSICQCFFWRFNSKMAPKEWSSRRNTYGSNPILWDPYISGSKI